MLASRYEERLIEGRLSKHDLERIKAAATAGWDPAVAQNPSYARAVEDVVFRRHDRTLKHVLPWIEKYQSLEGRRLIDFGSGCGSSALASSYFAAEVLSFEISQVSVQAYRTRMETLGRKNVHVTLAEPARIAQVAAEAIRPGDVVLLLAVVEHLTETEQYQYLKQFWDALSPGDVLVIVETPNRLAYMDTHTHQRPFYHLLPDQTFFNYLEKVAPESLRFKDGLIKSLSETGIEAASTQRRRLGLGVSYHEFEAAFGCDLNEVVLTDGFEEPIGSMFHTSIDDRLCVTAFEHHGIEAPIGFARSVLSFIFRKPMSASAAAELKSHNAARREAIFRQYSLLRV
jgi:2-polyprenyl-3-methyl-5-hydroxy-6-metoxy-1,4-benzoquinol methylase